MSAAPHSPPSITRTERGLSISGTQITLYDVMDYLAAQYPPTFIRSIFELTEGQLEAALSYINRNRAAVEAEYLLVLNQAEENRQYWEQRNREHLVHMATLPPRPGKEALWEALHIKGLMEQEGRDIEGSAAAIESSV